ncbi:methionyl-tRNA formyltransferase, partial [Staphylococcus capitis]
TKQANIVGTQSDDAIAITDMLLSGKRRMPVSNFLRGVQTSLVGKKVI